MKVHLPDNKKAAPKRRILNGIVVIFARVVLVGIVAGLACAVGYGSAAWSQCALSLFAVSASLAQAGAVFAAALVLMAWLCALVFLIGGRRG